MKMIMSVDPGESTGIYLVNQDTGGIILVDTVSPLEAKAFIKILVLICDELTLILEEFPISNSLPIYVADLYTYIVTNGDVELVMIKPGEWKPIAKKLGWKAEFGKTQHERDAINLARYYNWRESPNWDR